MFAGSYRFAKRPIQQLASDLFRLDVSLGMISELERRAGEVLYCWSQLRRDMQAMIDRQDEVSTIGADLLGSSDRLFHWWHKYRDGEIAWSTFLGYALPIRWGVREVLGRGASQTAGKTAATCRMLLEQEDCLWTFLKVPGIEPTNYAAERALRHAVLWRTTSGGTASQWGSRFVERVLSVAATCRLQGSNALDFLTQCFRSQASGSPVVSLVVPHGGISRAA